ncbi:hypothetical protein ABE426_08085 [Sphingobacterium faecium]|jgi:hypothetical protein|uniref:hypothetical protein n=1 Tax=Sphingobacterium TaxID=28453 RepID=UPI0025CC63DC|nr:hypothetical protein [Sphingobacterium sp. UBA6320]
MNKNKKMYIAPTIEELVIELEQGIAAGSGNAQPGAPTVNDEDGAGGSSWEVDGF